MKTVCFLALIVLLKDVICFSSAFRISATKRSSISSLRTDNVNHLTSRKAKVITDRNLSPSFKSFGTFPTLNYPHQITSKTCLSNSITTVFSAAKGNSKMVLQIKDHVEKSIILLLVSMYYLSRLYYIPCFVYATFTESPYTHPYLPAPVFRITHPYFQLAKKIVPPIKILHFPKIRVHKMVAMGFLKVLSKFVKKRLSSKGVI